MKLLRSLIGVFLALASLHGMAFAECEVVEFDANSNTIRFLLTDPADGTPITGLNNGSDGLLISVAANNAASATVYDGDAGNVETIAALGTFAAPTASKCRFAEFDTDMPGIYEVQFADAIFSAASSKSLIFMVRGVADMAGTVAACYVPLVHPLADITAAILDAVAADYNDAGSVGEAINDASTGGDVSAIADAVWDEPRTGHTTIGTFGEGVFLAPRRE